MARISQMVYSISSDNTGNSIHKLLKNHLVFSLANVLIIVSIGSSVSNRFLILWQTHAGAVEYRQI